MAEVLKAERRSEGDYTTTLVLDPHEAGIVVRAVRRVLAADKAEFDEKVTYLTATAGEQDWRNDPDILGEDEMIGRATQLLRDMVNGGV